MTIEGFMFSSLAYGLPVLGVAVAAVGWAVSSARKVGHVLAGGKPSQGTKKDKRLKKNKKGK